jgi:hypothetical protein
MYAEVRSSERQGHGQPKSISTYLGKVIDLEKGLFQNKKLGVFKYSLDSGFEEADINLSTSPNVQAQEKAILDFGSSHLLAEYSKQIGFWDLCRQTLPDCSDSLMALLFFYVEMAESNNEAMRWLSGSFSRLLFPMAQLQPRSVGELLARLGEETIKRDFFSRYLNSLPPSCKKKAILVDGAGLPNAVHFPSAAVIDHNGEISEEVRLIFVVDAESGLPLFFRYDPGDVFDGAWLKATLHELEKLGVSVGTAVLDAGYCSQDNIKALYGEKIDFLIRLPVYGKLFRDSLNACKDEALSDSCRHMHNDRAVGVKRIDASLFGRRAYLHLCVDYDSRNEGLKSFAEGAVADETARSRGGAYTDEMGFFALVSSKKIESDDLLPLYCTRQTVEQVFDARKNDFHMPPSLSPSLEVHSEETFRGHLMLTFMANILRLKLDQRFKGDEIFTARNALIEMRNLKCKVYDDAVLMKGMTKDMRKIAELVGISVPEMMSLPLERLQ